MIIAVRMSKCRIMCISFRRSDTPMQPSNVSVNQSSDANFNESQGSCEEIPANLHYEILIRETGKYFGTPQMEIVGARIR